MKKESTVRKTKQRKKEEEKISKKENKAQDEEKKRRRIIVIILILLLLIGFNVGEMLSRIPTKPMIKSKSNEWGTSNIVEIDKDSKAKNGIKYYLYCVSKERSGKDCKWKKTYTKNIEIKEDGEYYVLFKGV